MADPFDRNAPGADASAMALLTAAWDALAEPAFVLREGEGPGLRVALANRAWHDALGIAPGAAAGRDLAELLPPAAAQALEQGCRAAAGSKSPSELAWTARAGAPPVRSVLTPLFERGACMGFACVGQAAAADGGSDEALRRSEDRFARMAAALPDAVLIERDGVCVYANEAAARLLRFAGPAEVVGTSVIDAIPPDDRALALARMERARIHGEAAPLVELRMVARDGAALDVEEVRLPIDYGGARCTLAIARDLRGRKEMESQLHLADRMISVGTLAAGVAHEINNPLGYVIGNLGFLADGLAKLSGLGAERGVDVAALSTALQEVWDGAKRVRDIVHDLKTFSRTDVERRGPVDVRRVLEASIRLAQNELRHSASVAVVLPELPAVEGDGSRLSQVFLNLLINAAQAMPDRPAPQNHIRVSARVEGDRVAIEIRDNGEGMTGEVRRRIFDPFFTTKPAGVGTGLGLSIVHSIVTAMRGEIEVVSEPGEGTAFVLRLPRAQQPVPAPEAPAPPVPRDLHARVLIVDDEPLVGASIRRVLSGEHEVLAVTRGADALRRIVAGERFDALLCDLMMPEMTGMDLHAELSRSFPDQAGRMGFLTGGTFTKRATAFAERMADRTLAKPFSTEALRAFVRRLSGQQGS
ncbi:MAG: hypothetical protein NVSMB23_26110 [Myxococcales bacterium]